MQIHLRNSGDKEPKVIIENVVYFEPLLSVEHDGAIQYTVEGGDQTEFIDVDEDRAFIYGTETYDFCQVYA